MNSTLPASAPVSNSVAATLPGVMANSTHEAVKNEFVCEVCFETRNDRLSLNQLKTGNGDMLRKEDCGHKICRECMATWVTTRIGEQRVFGLRCPHEDCKNELFEQDLAKLPLAEGVLEQFAKLRAQDFTQRAKELRTTLLESIDSMKAARTLSEVARLCPRCSVVLQKAEGCNSFYCTCGHHFNYESAPRLFPPHLHKVLAYAKKFNMTLDEAEHAIGQGFLKAYRTSMQMGISPAEALELQKLAQKGDEAARERIRAARRNA